MVSRIRHSTQIILPPGLLTGLLLGIVQSLLIALVPVELNAVFLFLLVLILLLYLLVPLFARYNIVRRRELVPGANSIATRIGLICASLVILSTICVYALSISGVQVVESGGFLTFRLMSDSVLTLAAVVLYNAFGLLLSLCGGWIGKVLGARWMQSREEQ